MRAINRRRYFNSIEDTDPGALVGTGYDANDFGGAPALASTQNMIPIYIAGVIAIIGIFALIKSKP